MSCADLGVTDAVQGRAEQEIERANAAEAEAAGLTQQIQVKDSDRVDKQAVIGWLQHKLAEAQVRLAIIVYTSSSYTFSTGAVPIPQNPPNPIAKIRTHTRSFVSDNVHARTD